MTSLISIRTAFLPAISTTLLSLCFAVSMFAQMGNSVTGQVTGYQNTPLYDATVELLDAYGTVKMYTKTDGSGRYFFNNVARGRFAVRVRTLEAEYEEQTQDDEIVNIDRADINGNVRTSGMERKQLDFRMRIRKGFTGVTAALFIQNIPDNAKKLYTQAISDLNNKKEKEGLAGLKAAIEAFPTYYSALERYGMECVRLKQYQASATLLKLAVDVNPRSYRAWYGLAFSFNALGYIDEALKAVNKALEMYAGSTESLILAGVIYQTKKQFAEAEKSLLKAKEVSKDTLPMANWYLALIYGKEMKRYAAAANELKAFLKKQPESKDADMIKRLIADYEGKAKAS